MTVFLSGSGGVCLEFLDNTLLCSQEGLAGTLEVPGGSVVMNSLFCPLMVVWHENVIYILWLSFLIYTKIVFLKGSHDKGNGEKQDVI